MPDGAVIQAIDLAAVGRLADALLGRRVEVVAVCLLHAYANPAHERRVAARLRARGPDGRRLARGAARVPRIRALEHDRRQRLRRRRSWTATSARLAGGRRRRAGCWHHAVQRRHSAGRRGARRRPSARCSPAPPAGRRRAGGGAARPARPHHHLRHGRHLHGRQRWSTARADDDRVRDRRLPAPDAGHRHPHRRRRRRLASRASTPAARCASVRESAGADPGPACYGRGRPA